MADSDSTFFENRIRPILVAHCYECHAADAEQLGGNLRLDSREAVLRGGERGPGLVAGMPSESLIIKALRYDELEMPPSEPLSESVIADFERWISDGAIDPRVAHSAESDATNGNQLNERLWSLQPIQKYEPPNTADDTWSYSAIDRFVFARMKAAAVAPTLDAEPRFLARRIFVDLLGRPPSYSEVQEFTIVCNADRLLAVQRLVDDLLARPEFGQRWGRYWLDIARFGESNGNDGLGRNPTFPHAWRYRDYVIDSFNADLPYDQFLLEQIAGDLLSADSLEQSDRHKIATGFLAMAAKPAKAMNDNFDMDVVADQIDVIGRGLMGLSVACARCHDHKFDPVSTRDYYALAGIFTSTETMWGLAANEKLTAPPTDLHVLNAARGNPVPEDFVETVILLESATGKPKVIPEPEWPAGTPLAMGVRDRQKIVDCKININGDAKNLGMQVPRGLLPALSLECAEALSVPADQSGRLELAKWLTHPDHPLTARVMVNRIWMHLFGRGIVATPDDYGVYGQRPTHPKLLDYLATQFVENRWSVKRLIREIVLSRTYQLSANAIPSLTEADPENRWLTRHARRRMDAEVIRDSMLWASGQLDLSRPSGSIIQHRDILVNLAGSLHQPSRHCSVYLCYLRSSPPPELAPFNLPDFTEVVGQRESTTVSSQTLYLLNSPFVIQQAEALASQVLWASTDTTQRIQSAFRRALHRDPTPAELTDAIALVSNLAGNGDAEPNTMEIGSWAIFCQALLITSEFRYVD